jgi:hypothetical protein
VTVRNDLFHDALVYLMFGAILFLKDSVVLGPIKRVAEYWKIFLPKFPVAMYLYSFSEYYLILLFIYLFVCLFV